MKPSVEFVFVCCQVGTEAALKNDLARNHPELRFAFSRPGFVTFKVAEGGSFDLAQPMKSPFARTHGVSTGSLKLPVNEEATDAPLSAPSPAAPAPASESPASESPTLESPTLESPTLESSTPESHTLESPAAAVSPPSSWPPLPAVAPAQLAEALKLLPDLPFKHLHVWQRDLHVPGERHFEPFHTADAIELGKQLRAAAEPEQALREAAINRTAKAGDLVADVIVVDPRHWFLGWHTASTMPTRWAGGVPPLRAKEGMVSRAYLKMEEALKWSRLPIRKADVCIELGSSPGGSCQSLLEHGLHVFGIDPAKMHDDVMKHPNFTHIRARAADLKRKEYAKARWLMSDSNLDPKSTLDAIEPIVTHRVVNIRGMLITLKLLDPKMVKDIDQHLTRIRSWGYRYIKARQLAFNRNEICVLAMKKKFEINRGRAGK